MRALQTGNVHNISENVDAKQNIIEFFKRIITYRSNFIHVCKIIIETLFSICFDVDSYVQLR